MQRSAQSDDGASGSRPGGPAADPRITQARELAHDVRNALNGAAVNLEAARAKAERGDTAVQDLVPFLSRAAEQIDAVARLSKTALTMLNEALEDQASTDPHSKMT